jgi:esterase/lipase
MILKDADTIYNFLINVRKFQQQNIIILGRCMGSGPAIYLAGRYQPKGLILISPFISIKKAVKSILDKLSIGWVSSLIVERLIYF